MSDDTRMEVGLGDVKAGTAALNDAQTVFREFLEEGPGLSERHRQMLEANCVALSRIVMRANAVIGSTVRILDETGGQQ